MSSKFVIGRLKTSDYVSVQIPMTSAVVTVLYFGMRNHHQAACAVVGELALSIPDSFIDQALDERTAFRAKQVIAQLRGDSRHSPKDSRFLQDLQGDLLAIIHPTELYAMGVSAEQHLDDVDEDDESSIYRSLDMWARGASQFVNDREMLAIYEKEGHA